MPSSRLTLAVRAMVMLTALVALPLFAVFGFSLPERMLDKIPWFRWEVFAGGSRDLGANDPPPDAAPRRISALTADGEVSTTPAVVAASHVVPTESAEVLSTDDNSLNINPPDGERESISAGTARQPKRPSGLLKPMEQTGEASQPTVAVSDWAGKPSPFDLEAVTPALSVEPPPRFDRVAATGDADLTDKTPPALSDEAISRQTRDVQHRLRELGATYYLLETWGAEEDQLYRFQCKMAVVAAPGLARHFEAVGNDPLAAMREVLGEVEAWRAATSAAGP